METSSSSFEVARVKINGNQETSSITEAQRSFLTLKCVVGLSLQLVLTQSQSKQNLGHYVFNDGRGGRALLPQETVTLTL